MDEPILWHRAGSPGHDTARLETRGGAPRVEGVAVFGWEGAACRLDYAVQCDNDWRSVRVAVVGWIGRRRVAIEMAANGDREWWLERESRPDVRGAFDADLAFTPATNLLPIRRLDLRAGETAEVTSAWLTFPELALEPLRQRYTRTAEETYAYEAPDLGFAAELTVDGRGFVTRYEGLWEAEGPG